MTEERFKTLLTGLNSADKTVRQTSVHQLGALGDKRAIEPLIKALDDTDPWVLMSVSWSLGRLQDKRAIEPLIKHLDQHAAVFGLEELGKDALLAVTNALQTLSEKRRHNALQVIRQFLFIHRSWSRPIIEQEAFEKVLHVLNDEDANNRGYAIILLGDIGNIQAVAAIQELANDQSNYVRWCVANVLGMLGGFSSIEVLEKMRNIDSGTINIYNPEGGTRLERISDVAARSIQQIQERNR